MAIGNVQFKTLLLKASSGQVWIRYQCFVSLNCSFLFADSHQKCKWLAHFLFTRSNGEACRKTF